MSMPTTATTSEATHTQAHIHTHTEHIDRDTPKGQSCGYPARNARVFTRTGGHVDFRAFARQVSASP